MINCKLMTRDTSSLINIPGQLHSIAYDNIVTSTSEIYDYDINRRQSDINHTQEQRYTLTNGVFDISAYTNMGYDNFRSALNSGNNIPVEYRFNGMSAKYKNNKTGKYYQWRYTLESTEDEDISNLDNWVRFDEGEPIDINIPDDIYSYVGDNLYLYKYPLTLLPDYQYYGVSINVTPTVVGNVKVMNYYDTKRSAIISPLKEGDYQVKINVTDDLYIIGSKTCNLHVRVVPDTSGLVVDPSTFRNVLVIGDEQTTGQGSGEPYTNEANRILTSNDSATSTRPAGLGLTTVQFIGSQNTANARHEAYNNANVAYFADASTSPFAFNGNIDFVQYLMQDSIYNDSSHKGVDLIYITLGRSSIHYTTIDKKVVFSNYHDYMDKLIELLRKIKEQIITSYYNPGLKVILLTYTFTDTDAYDFGYPDEHARLYKDGIFHAKLYKAIADINANIASMDEFKTFVEAKTLSSQVDSENAYPVAPIQGNPYISTMETNTYDGVRLNVVGCRMFGASVARDILGHLPENLGYESITND